jgi:SNF2 family DNA or RNA helicase
MIYKPYPYQDFATEHVITNPASGLLLEMGLGKTVSTLTAIDKLMFDQCEVSRVLVIAPKRVADEVWTTESTKWDHLRHLRISKILGTEKQRKEALKAKADIYVINCENVVWLIAQLGGAWPFDMVVVDESTKFKSAKSARFKALRQILPKINRRVILTGTPIPNGLLDLWPQVYLLDQGERLGKTLTSYRDQYFKAGQRNAHVIFNYELRTNTDELIGSDVYEKEIYSKIGDICISMRTEDYLNLPPLINRDINVRFSAKVKQQYDDFEREQVLALEDVEEISAVNAAALGNKLLQFSNGAVYGADKKYYEVHNEKIEELDELLDVANGKPFFVFYSYRHDVERIHRHLKKYKPRELKSSGDIHDWNRGTVPFMLAHPASAGHGLNLQAGGHNVGWFGLPWSLELYKQGVTRFHRQGQEMSVINNRIIAPGTMDMNVLQVLDEKAGNQDLLMNAVKAVVRKHRTALMV